MKAPASRSGFAARPTDAETWIKSSDLPRSQRTNAGEGFTARLTIDVKPHMRARIKVAAFQRGMTVAEMLRGVFEREFPASTDDAP